MRTAAYIRVSSKDQIEGYSLDTQRQLIEDYCRRHGLPEPEVYADEGISAFTDDLDKRPAFRRLLLAAEAGQVGLVVILDVDRFARSALTALVAKDRLNRAGCGFTSLYQPYDFDTPDGHLMYTVQSGMAEYYSRQLSRKVRAALDQKRREGGHVGGIPYGARRVDGGRLELAPATIEPLALLLDLAAVEGNSRVAAALNARGYPAPRTAYWSAWSVGSVVRSGAWLLDQPDPWPARWSAARARPRLPRLPAGREPHLLTGLLRCPCGGRLIYRRGHPGQPDGLYCSNPRARPTPAGCPHRRSYARVYEAAVEADLFRLPDLTAAAVEEADTTGERAALIEEKRRLGQLYRRGAIGEAEWERDTDAIDARLARLPGAGRRRRALAATLADVRAEWPELTIPERNAALRALYDHILVDGATVTCVPGADLAELLAAWAGSHK